MSDEYKIIPIKKNNNYIRVLDIVTDISNNNLKNKFNLVSKYDNTVDLRHESSLCSPFLYDKSFVDILFDNNIPSLCEENIKKKLFLYHIQYRIAYKNKKSYQEWHRDTHFSDKSKTFSGNTPPVYKLIIYPKMKDQENEICLQIKPNSHFVYKNNGYEYTDYDRNDLINKYTDYPDKIIDIYNGDNMLLFNTSLYHNAVMPTNNESQTRIIYSFTHDKKIISTKMKNENKDLIKYYIDKNKYSYSIFDE